MDRRTLLKLIAATAVVGCERDKASAAKLRVVVAGAGIIGASIAYHLAKNGAQVTVLDQHSPASHASRGTFAWINATWAKQPRDYHQLSQASVAYWAELDQALAMQVRWGGSLEWFDTAERQEKLALQIAEQIEWEEAARMVDAAEFRTLEPNVNFDDKELAALSANDGAVDPVRATQQFLAAAKEYGATVEFPSELLSVNMTNGRLVSVNTSTGPLAADRLVLATGAAPDVCSKLAGIDIPQRTTPGIIALTKPMAPIINHIIAAPGVHMHQRTDGRVVIGEQDGAPGNDAHEMRLAERPNDFPSATIAQEHGKRMLAVGTQFAPQLAAAEIEDVYIGWRPLPVDGHPVIGPAPQRKDVYIAIMHSGVTLAPIAGRLAAAEVISGERMGELKNYRADRDFETVKRY